MVEVYGSSPDTLLQVAGREGITVVASATLLQGSVLEQMPDVVAEMLPGLSSNAQRAIQFTRSTPGVTVALTGMSKPEHVMENLGVAGVAPATHEQYQRFYE